MDRSKVDLEGLHDPAIEALKSVQPSADVPFNITKMGHAVLMVRDIDVAVQFYTQVLGFKVSDVYPDGRDSCAGKSPDCPRRGCETRTPAFGRG